MKLQPLAQSLYDQLAELPTVDVHEHLHAEELRLARRVAEGQFDESRALWIAKRWFHDNLREAYGV